MNLTQKQLKEELNYSPQTGVFTWRKRVDHYHDIGDAITGQCGEGYIQIRVLGKQYRGHRLAFLYQEGAFPTSRVDHIDQVKTNNSWGNLRVSSASANAKNCKMQANNTSGITGVCWDKGRGKWLAQIKVDGQNIYLGRFNNISEAQEAREASSVLYGYSERHGK